MKLNFDSVFRPTVLHPSVKPLFPGHADSWVLSAVSAQADHLIVLSSACEKPRRLHCPFSMPLLHIGFSFPGTLQTGGTSDLLRICTGLFTSSPWKQLLLMLLLFSFQNKQTTTSKQCESLDRNSFTFWGLSCNHGDTFLSLRVIFASFVRRNYFASRQKEAWRGNREATVPCCSEPLKMREEKVAPGKFKANGQMRYFQEYKWEFVLMALPLSWLTYPTTQKNK